MQKIAEDTPGSLTNEPVQITADSVHGEVEVLGSFWDHLEALCSALRFCLITISAGWLFCFIFSDRLLPLLYLPLSQVTEVQSLVLLSPLEGISITSQLSFWVSFSLTAPIWGWKLLQFFLPALYRGERRLLLPFLLVSCFILTGSGYFAWAVTLPIANRFLSSWSMPLGVPFWSLSAYMEYALTLLFGHMVAGELVLLLAIAVHTGWITHVQLQRARRMVIVLILFVSALLTPPDIVTQLMMAFPLWVLYELMIFYARVKGVSNLSIRALSRSIC